MKNLFRSLLLILAATTFLVGCERLPVETVQRGYRGTGMEQIYNPRTVAVQAKLNAAPAALDTASPDGPKAGQVYQNVKVLGDLSVGEFTRLMTAMTSWVSPGEGCTYCHNAQNFADDSKYTKVVARRMVQMTQSVNADWKSHVASTGVTCYTCHRGNPVPKEVWFTPGKNKYNGGSLGDDAGQNHPAKTVGLSSLPYDPFTPYLKGDQPIRVNGKEALNVTGAHANRASSKQAEFTYGLMVHMSSSLGVNCTYCHNTRSFQSWEESPPQRSTAYYGIRMARELNNTFMEPLTKTFPDHRLGETGDVAKVNCATCHQGAYKPLYGAAMAKDYPELTKQATSGVSAPSQAAAAPVSGQ